MIFSKPVPFAEAVASREARLLLPTDLSARELGEIDSAIRERSVAMARVSNASYLQLAANVADAVVRGEITQQEAIRRLRELREEITGKDAQGLTAELFSDGRLALVVRMQVEQAFGLGQWRQGQSQPVLDRWPCSEFYRAAYRVEPRDWPARWAAAGGKFYGGHSDYPEGRMIARKDDPIWVAINAFGVPYMPADYNSGMDQRDIAREEAVALGVIKRDERVEPAEHNFEEDFGAGGRELDDDLRAALLDELGPDYAFEDGVLTKANEVDDRSANSAAILQLANAERIRRIRDRLSPPASGDTNVSVKAVVRNRRGEVLVLKDARSDWHDLPGGHVKFGEGHEAALRREVSEETGLRLDGLLRHHAEDALLGGRATRVVFYSAAASGEPKLSNEHSSFEWVPRRALANKNLGVLLDAANKV